MQTARAYIRPVFFKEEKPQLFDRLIRRGFLTPQALKDLQSKSGKNGLCLEDAIMAAGVPRHEVLFCLAEKFGCPFVEYDENLVISQSIIRQIDVEKLKAELWLPVSIHEGSAEVIACWPDDPELNRHIRATLGIDNLSFLVATRTDLVRIIENNWDMNRDFPPSAGRTPLARTRTYLAGLRSGYATQRTILARGRTGLAFIRTGLAFITISVTFLRLFGAGLQLVMEAPLMGLGIAAIVDGLLWYLPARRETKDIYHCPPYDVPEGFTALETLNPGENPKFGRSPVVKSAGALRKEWNSLSPVERRRFLANDRLNMAEERTALAYLRTIMAKARTGLAFTRTGTAFAGLGIGFIRKFPAGPWTFFDWALITAGALMLAEGFHWYMPGRKAANAGLESVEKAGGIKTIWDRVFPSFGQFEFMDEEQMLEKRPVPPVGPGQHPGVWATTGLALERTLLADRRNVMAGLRTVMARSRTGMAFIRTGFSILTAGGGLFIYFFGGSAFWTAIELLLIVVGLYLIADGLFWSIPAERMKKQLPYCFGDFEIQLPDYSEPCSSWGKVFFSHDR